VNSSAGRSSVVVNDFSRENADKVAKQIKSAGGKAIANYDNVATSGKAIIDQIIKEYGRIDVVINNAGIVSSPYTSLFKAHSCCKAARQVGEFIRGRTEMHLEPEPSSRP
jgi:NAD(P)-dependent dehydrogenase (short-subunit alcohol dehydrogenase family)